MITFLMAFRAYSEKNVEGFKKLLISLDTYFSNYELLVKVDTDDTRGIVFVKSLNRDNIKSFIFNRWEGRWTINYFYDYLFLHRNLQSKYIAMVTDDCVITRNFINNLDDEHLIFGDYKGDMIKERLEKIDNVKEEKGLSTEYICSYPVISARLIEITGSFGYQANPDSHLALLNIIMYQKYGIILAKHIPEFLIRDNIDRLDNHGIDFVKGQITTDSDMCSNDYIFILVEQQAINIYLNRRR